LEILKNPKHLHRTYKLNKENNLFHKNKQTSRAHLRAELNGVRVQWVGLANPLTRVNNKEANS